MNDVSFRYMLDDKTVFNTMFSDMLKREWLDLRTVDEEAFSDFIYRHKVFFAKPINLFGGKGIIRISTADISDISEVYRTLKEEHKYCIEEEIIQHSKMNLLSKSSVNSLRITTLFVKDTVNVIYSLVRIGASDSYVDNISSGGMYCPVDENGFITAEAFCDSKIEYFKVHPKTKTEFVGFEIPYYKQAISLVIAASLRVKELKYIGWDVAITESGPVLIEGNTIPGYDMPQNYRHLKGNKEGLLPRIESLLNQ